MGTMESLRIIETKRTRIDTLVQAGKIVGVIGNPQDNDNFSFTTWTRKPPADYLLNYVEVSNFLNPSGKLLVLVDDVLSMAYFTRSKNEQEVYNWEYRRIFESTQKARVLFASIVLPKMNYSDLLITHGRKVSVKNFIAMLPESKRNKVKSLRLNEVIFALQNLILLDFLAQESNTVMGGKGTMAMVTCHRNISKNPLSGIFLPPSKLTGEKKCV